MRIILLLTLIFCFGLVFQTQAQGDKVNKKKFKNVDMSPYKTFDIVDLKIEDLPHFKAREKGIQRFLDGVKSEMISRGYTEDEDNPDLIINIAAYITEEVQTRETTLREAPPYIGQRNYHWEVQDVPIGTYTQGTVVMDLVDAKKNELIWQNSADRVLYDKNREKNDKNIDAGLKKLFKKFPKKK